MFSNIFSSPQSAAAFRRAIAGGLVAASAAAIAWLATEPKYAVFAGIAGAFFTRFMAEGGYDAGRAEKGEVHSSDVGS